MISVAASSLPVGSPSPMGPPNCRPRTVAVVRSLAPSAPIIWREPAGKAVWSPVSSMNRVGTVTPGAQRTKSALELSPDQVDSHASRVVSRPKPVRP
jgi:hypothetical protein